MASAAPGGAGSGGSRKRDVAGERPELLEQVAEILVLHELDARGHQQQIADRDGVEAAAAQLRQIVDDRVVDAADVPLVDGDADECRGD